MVFWICAIYCAFFVRVGVRFCLMYVCSISRVRVNVRVRVKVFWNAYNQLLVLKGEEHTRDIVFLSLYVYVCAYEFMCFCVRFHRCIYKYWRFFVGQVEGVPMWFEPKEYSWEFLCNPIWSSSDVVWVKGIILCRSSCLWWSGYRYCLFSD